ncbi:MAG: T9SS type A sorting domain-containing protein, partial [Bacteroidota bacterium]
WLQASFNDWFLRLLYTTIGLETVNIAYANSSIHGEVRWHMDYIDFDFTSSAFRDIDNMASSEEIQDLREYYGADLVFMFSNQGYANGEIFGIVNETAQDFDAAYSIVEINSLLSPDFGLAHEYGHLFGAQHNPSSSNPNPSDCPYAHFYNATKTILVNSADPPNQARNRILNYSNPGVIVGGAPTGLENRNNAGKISAGHCAVADYFPPSLFSVDIIGSGSLCRCLPVPPPTGSYRELGEFTAQVNTPAQAFPGLPPYTYRWYYNSSGIFTSQNPGIYLGNTESIDFISLVADIPCEHFFLYVEVESSDNEVVRDTKRIYTGQCRGCNTCNNPKIHYVNHELNISLNSFDFNVYPNPSGLNEILVNYSGVGDTTVQFILQNQTGLMIEKWSIRETTENYGRNFLKLPEQLSKGIYFLTGVSKNEIVTKKIIRL